MPPNEDMAVIVEDLTMAYPHGRQVLRGVNLRVPEGQFVSLVGTNGAGKSTLLRCLVRLHEPISGAIKLSGRDVSRATPRELRGIRTRVGMVFQHFNLSNRLSAFANVLLGSAGTTGMRSVIMPLAPQDARVAVMESLERVGAADLAHRRVETLSGGQRQRVAIARMLVQRPALVLADEPVASLDPRAGVEVMNLLRAIAVEDHLTVIAALHHVDLALAYTDRIIGLQAGRIELDQPTATVDARQVQAVYGRESKAQSA